MRRHQLHNLNIRRFGLRVLAVLTVAAVIAIEAAPSFAQFRPPNRGMPGRREGGGTRGGGCPLQKPGLTALMPDSNLGMTVAPQPTFFWYLPQNSVAAAEFTLLGPDNTEIYKTLVTVPTQGGVVSLSLPQDKQLEVGQSYRWYFSLICDPLDRSEDTFTSGWVERVDPSPELSTSLKTASAAEVPNLYAQAGLWYDALAALVSLRQSQPQNPAFVTEWRELLGAVNLEALANQPISSAQLSEAQLKSQLKSQPLPY